jgi:phosphatidylglycerophosphate synthase
MSRSTPADAASSPVASTFRAQHRGGGLFSEHVSQRAGSLLAWAAHRLGLSPSTVTLAGLVVGVGSSVALVQWASATIRPGSAVIMGLAVGLGWQLAYALDCADGQLARVTGRTSPAGARLDILCDVAVQISVVAALTAVTAEYAPATPAWLYALFAGTWMVNLVTSVLSHGSVAASLVRSRSGLIRVAKLVRDYGAVIAVCALVVAVVPGWTVGLLAAMSMLNGLFLLANIVQAARQSPT